MIWRINTILVIGCILFVLSGLVNGSVVDQNTTITLERGMCYGTCPVYSLTLSANGTVIYDGKMYVKEIGVRNGTINASVYTSLMDTFEKADFFLMEDAYTAYDITDMPSATLTLQKVNQTKRIEHYYGDLKAPEMLTELEDAVDNSVNVTRWTTPYAMENIGREEI